MFNLLPALAKTSRLKTPLLAHMRTKIEWIAIQGLPGADSKSNSGGDGGITVTGCPRPRKVWGSVGRGCHTSKRIGRDLEKKNALDNQSNASDSSLHSAEGGTRPPRFFLTLQQIEVTVRSSFLQGTCVRSAFGVCGQQPLPLSPTLSH